MLSPPHLAGLALAAVLGSATSAVAVPMNGTSSGVSAAYPYAASSVYASAAGASAVSSLPATAASAFPTALPSSAPDVCPSVSVQTVTVTVTAPSKPSATSGGPDEYPAIEVRGEGAWASAVARARNMTAGWTLEQLVNVTTGVGWMAGPCVGNIASQPEIGFPGLCLQDGPLGLRFSDLASVFPAGVNAASTFDRKLIRARGVAMGEEFRVKGVNIALGPAIGIGRNAQGGRNWESFGADPYLVGEAAYETVKGIQSTGVQANAKHFIGNEEEHNRTYSSSNIDDRTMHEIYLHPFLKAVQADVASVMCSYNLINNTYACENSKAQNDLLKRELGYKGYVLSDWQATMSGPPSVNAGLDMTMPGDVTFNSGSTYFGANLTLAVNNGSVPLDRVKDMAVRIVSSWFLLEQDRDFPATNFDSWDPLGKGEHIDVRADHHEVIREIGAASTVLLKNVNGALPLGRDLKTIALIGNAAGPSSKGPNGYADRGGLDGVLGEGWGSGTADYTYLISPLEAMQSYAVKNRQVIRWTLDNFDYVTINKTATYADAALVFIASDSGEQYIVVDSNEGDRNNLTAWMDGDKMVEAVAANNANTVVIVQSVGPILMPWADHPNITAIVYSGLAGQEAGNSLVDVLSGAYSPAGRLPFTIAKQFDDYPTMIPFYPPSKEYVQVDYSEKLEIDYRHFQAKSIEPLFGFGYGLSYADFGLSNLTVSERPMSKRHLADEHVYRRSWDESPANSTAAAGNSTASKPVGQVGSSVAEWLHSPRITVSFDVTNESRNMSTESCTVPQLYLGFPASAGEPPKVLRGFEHVKLAGGATERVTIELSTYDISIWDVVSQTWTRPDGEFTVFVGQSAFDDDSLTATF